jgi:8-amino-7-oxononanoate synthase
MSSKAPIAIVGMGCQFPKAPDVAAYWRNIREARVCFSDVPKERWNHALYYHPSARELDKAYARQCGFIDDVRSFAAMHYGISPLRVKVMDPQHRLLVETARVTLSDAGYETRPLKRESTGVFVGASVSEHKDILTSRLRAAQLFDGAWGRVVELPPEVRAAAVEDVAPVRAFSIAGNLLNMMSATVAQVFDLGGPAFTVDAACSSALVAIFEAILHLRSGECDSALAGGVYLNLTPDNLVGFSRIGAISRSDRCRPFDASADGFVLGEGVGLVMLKRLDDALRDGDRIYAVVRGAGLNNDGRGEGPMTPRQGGQLAAIARAYADCDFTPDTLGFIEAHGTATGVGDVVEVAALKEYFGAHRQGPIDAVISSVKANVGHTMSAAGVAGLIKAALVLSERTIPPQAAFSAQHPSLNLAFDEGSFRIATKEEPWLAPAGHPRRAAVSSFGFGGTNCHLVLEEAPAEKVRIAVPAPSQPEPFVISAPTPALLATHLTALREALREGEAARAPLADLACTLSTRKRENACVAFVATSRDELTRKLEDALALVGEPAPVSRSGIRFTAAPLAENDRRIAFLFPGQGAQAVGLCESLYRRLPRFRARLDALLDGPLLSHLYPRAPFDAAEATAALTRTEICQPVMAGLGIALSELAMALGLTPSMTIGHSLGEFAALAAGGVLNADETVRFVAERGGLMAQLAGDHGAMAAVATSRATVERYVAEFPGTAVANVNHPNQVVVAGATDAVEALVARLAADGIQATRLQVSHAFHSPLVAPADADITQRVAQLELHPAAVPVISCIEPGPYPADADAARQIMARHATSAVDFVSGIQRCAEAGGRVFIQVGAGTALLSMARSTLKATDMRPAAMVSLAASDAAATDGGRRLCDSLVELAALGVPVDFAALYAGDTRVVSLPATPLETEKYWIANREERPPLPPLVVTQESDVKPNTSPSEALVALFREQMAVLQQQNEIIRRQTEALGGGVTITTPQPAREERPAPQPLPAPAATTPAAPVKAIVKDGAIEGQVLDVVARVSAFPRASVKPEQRLVSDLGFDSLMSVELSAKLADAFAGLGGLPKSLLVETTTVRDVVAYVETKLSKGDSAAPAIRAERAQSTEISRYAPAWVARPLSAPPPFAEPPFAGPTLILADALGVAPLLAALLNRAGQPAIVAGPEALLALETPRAIIDLRALAPAVDALSAPASNLREPVEAAFHLARVASRNGAPSCFAVAFAGDAAAGLAGFAKALAREWQESRVKAIELDASTAPDALAASIAAELLSGDAMVEVRYQGARREIVELTRTEIEGVAGTLGEGAVVAISGGAGGLGGKLALELARRYRAKIALLGRSEANGATAALLREITAAGGVAVYLSCDVRDEASTAAALVEARRQLGPIEAVVHAAGVIADAPIGKKRDEDFARVFDTKVGGALSLWRATAGDPLKRFVVYGSWAGRFGNASQTDYSAANHLAARLTALFGAARPAVRVATLDLPPWEESAMVRTIPAAAREMMRADGVTFLSDAAGLDLVLREFGASGPSGEVLFGRDIPAAEREIETSVKLTVATHPYLGDHRVDGRPVLPLAAAMDHAAGVALSLAGPLAPGAALVLKEFELIDGVALAGDAIWLHARATRQGGGHIAVELRWSATADGKRTLAYRCEASVVAGTLPDVAQPATREQPSLALSEFYASHTFHGPLMRGVVAVTDLGPAHVSGRVRAAKLHELLSIPAALAVDPLLIDSSFQLAAYWAFVRHGRAGLPLGFDEYRALAPIAPGSEVHCLLSLEQAQGDLFIGNIDYRDASGRLVAQLRGMKAQLREVAAKAHVDPAYYRVEEFPEYLDLRQRFEMAEASGIGNPYFHVHERVTNDTSRVDGREMLNFSSYNYLGLSGDADVNREVAEAVERYGTSVSASRVASGEKPLHRELEATLARFLGCEDSVVMVGGHATNVSVVGHICGPGDLVIHDSLAHDSILAGAKLSGAGRRAFPHNDWEALDRTLTLVRPNVKRVLIAIEGTYSMDGDIPPLDKIIEVKKRHKAMLLVDEAHSLGVLGRTGRGVGEHFNVNRSDVELWMGTLSKSVASCGGYIAGSKAMVEYLKYTVGGFVFSVGISPPNAASALAALRKLEAHPELVTRLHERARFFLELCRERGINTGLSEGSAVVPCIVGNSWDCLQLAQALGRRGINVQPILYPAVEEHLARLRFFITSRHSEEQLRITADAVAEELALLNPEYVERATPAWRNRAAKANGAVAVQPEV